MAKLEFLIEYNKTVQLMADRQLLAYTGDFYKESSVRNWRSKIYIFSMYLKKVGGLNLKKIDFHFCNNFQIYLLESGYSKNSVGNIMGILRAFIKRLHKQGLIKYSGFGISTKSEITTAVFSTVDDLKTLYRYNGTPGENRVRDIYICQCFLGLRFSDMNRFLRGIPQYLKNVNGVDFFEMKTSKTGDVVAIPASDIVMDIATARNFDFGKPITQQYYSKTLKKIVRKSGIDRDLIFQRTEGGVMTERIVKYSDLIGTHTARRTFATNAFLSGIASLDIMKITGHRSFNSFIRYIRCDNIEVALRIAKHDFFKTQL